MSHSRILFRSAAREKILSGANQLADAVRLTLGPKSRSVLIQKTWGAPLVCNDGVTIAKQVKLPDPEEQLGAQMLRQAAEKTGELVGDGTSTSTLLAHAIFSDGLRNVVAGASAVDLRRGLDRGLEAAVQSLRAQSRPVLSRQEKVQVATISAHNDPRIGDLVADAMERVGGEGVILDLNSASYFGLAEVGVAFWKFLQADPSFRIAFDQLLEMYDVAPERLEADLQALVDQLREAGLVTVD